MAVNPQQTVHTRHNEDQISAAMFINQNWPVLGNRVAPIDMNSFITYAVSTTLNSSVLLIAKGYRSMFTRNTYSADPGNPWLIFQVAQENQALARHIQDRWDDMVIHGDLNEVNKIAAHVLYQKVGNNWEPVPLPEADGSNVVRFRVNDIEIWSHPPRDEPLMTALRGIEQFRRAEGALRSLGRALINLRNNKNIPLDKRQGALRSKRDEIKGQFVKVYGFYEKPPLPESYQWPTLQLGQRIGTGEDLRYGATFAGVYERFANEVHNKFAASNVEARPLHVPPQATVYYDLLPQEEFALSFEDMMQDDI